jgi:hypothetical protein
MDQMGVSAVGSRVPPPTRSGGVRRRLAALAVAGTVINLAVGVLVRVTLPVSHRATGWVVRPLILFGHTEHLVPRLSTGTVVAVATAVLAMILAPTLQGTRLLVTAAALAMAGGLANMLEALLRGSASDYLAFRRVPRFDQGVYNLADLEIGAALVLTVVGGLSAFFAVQREHLRASRQ